VVAQVLTVTYEFGEAALTGSRYILISNISRGNTWPQFADVLMLGLNRVDITPVPDLLQTKQPDMPQSA
jgi:hypothetical protein